MRADAQKNYDKIVAAAAEVFREKGLDAPLDDVVQRAGVGAGTLYRHFPTREDLVEAIVRSWTAEIDAAADDAVASAHDTRSALNSWFATYVARISRNKGGPAKLTAAMGNSESPIFSKCEALRLANQRVIQHFQSEGTLRGDVDALEVCRLVGGVAVVADQGGLDPTAVSAMLGVVVDGLLA